MKTDGKLSSVLHVLLHMAQSERAITSDELARYLATNPVVVRRVLASLRERGYVASSKGHGGGWSIACDLGTVTLLDIYRAVGEPAVFAMGNRVENPACVVEQAVNGALDEAFEQAEAVLVSRLGEITLAELAESVGQRLRRRLGGRRGGDVHAR